MSTRLDGGTRAYLEVLVEDAAHGGKGAVALLVSDEPGFGRAELLRVDVDETSGLGEGLQHKRRQPGETAGPRKGYDKKTRANTDAGNEKLGLQSAQECH